MILHRIFTPGLAINSYLIVDPITKKSAVIDSTRLTGPLLELIEKEHAHVTVILETHVHADFISGSKEIKHQLGDNPSIFCSFMGGEEWIPNYADFLLQDRQEILLGSLRLQAWHTPGHTPEHMMWLVFDDSSEIPICALTGDFLFFGSVGRPDLLGEANTEKLADELYNSVFTILPEMPDSMEIYPAHGAGSLCGQGIKSKLSSTMGLERSQNPFLQPKLKKEWIENILKNMSAAPSYFSLMKHLNILGVPLLSDLPSPKKLSGSELKGYSLNDFFLLDIRNKEGFASKHIPGSINIPLSDLFVHWVPEIYSFDLPIIVIGENEMAVKQAISTMQLVAVDKVVGYCIMDAEAWSGFKDYASFPMISPQEVYRELKEQPNNTLIIDVRTIPEWLSGHIEGALHLELPNLLHQMDSLPKDRRIGTVCGSGYRASIAASILQSKGINEVFNIMGGMNEWQKEQLPVS